MSSTKTHQTKIMRPQTPKARQTPKGPQTPQARLKALRGLMAAKGLDWYLVPSSDEFQNEYPPAHHLRRQAISGFTGSAGDAVAGLKEARLFVDSRYHLQASAEAAPDFVVHKVGEPGAADLYQWVAALAGEARQPPPVLGYDPFVMSLGVLKKLRRAAGRGVRLKPVKGNLVDKVWGGRPLPLRHPVTPLADSLTGEGVSSKLERVRAVMARRGAFCLVLTRLDEVAWLTNLRGGDIPCNPVFESTMILTPDHAVCFTDSPLAEEARRGLEGVVDFAPLGAFGPRLARLAAETDWAGAGALWLDPQSASAGVRALAAKAPLLEETPGPVTRLKGVKNPVEIVCIREAHRLTGAAKVKSFAALSRMLGRGEEITEAGYARLLEDCYGQMAGFRQLSFPTIAAYGPNAAVVHYGPPSPRVKLAPGGMLLVDSGAQLSGATTDDTRTLAIGPADPLLAKRYTQVLKAHIRLAGQVFPEGTTGVVLDGLTRSALWEEGMDYGHGTGHGVGAFLNVHEGPVSISPRGTLPLEEGMVLSIEPGYYHPGWGGIRLENLYVVEEALGFPPHPAGGRWLRFSPLTLIPFDAASIQVDRLTPGEAGWLTAYHRLVAQNLAGLLTAEETRWLLAQAETPGFGQPIASP